jgi:Flp pilus assembly protein TadG
MGHRHRLDRGAAALEFAVLVPLALLIVFEIIAWGYMFSFRQALSQAAAEGARAAVGGSTVGCAASGTWNASGCAAGTSAATAVAASLNSFKNNGTPLSCGAGGLTCTIQQAAAGNCASGHTCIQVQVTYPYRSQPLLRGMPTAIPPFNLVLPPDLTFTSVVEVS